ncbi:MAG: Thiamine-phosphate synthase [Verrucomicrobiae bacterium]|nr:Thiamine-phosphate synthase [Verrucomicrobiae bacterium]
MSHSAIAGCRLYGFIDTGYLAGRSPAELTRALVTGGVDIIQVRAKELPHAQRVELALAVIGVAFRAGVPVIVNDDIDAAYESGADGVHLGQEDWAATPRDRLANMRIVGISTHSLAQAQQAERDGASYIGVGPVFPTGTKPNVKPVGLELVKQVAGKVAVPFFAIGGINMKNLELVKTAGATRVAVVSAILQAPDVAQAARKFKEKLGGPAVSQK